MPVHESDVCVIGGGITAVMLIERLAQLKPGLRITVVEAGRSIFDRENRPTYHRRALEYGEHPWHDDYIEDQTAKGWISMTMAVGGQALHWGGACNRFSEEDLRLKSMYGLSDDWSLTWSELEKYYVQAEHRLHVAGDPSPYPEDRRSGPYSQQALPLSYNLQVLKKWAEQSGLKFSPLPTSRNITGPADGRGTCGLYDTCGDVCPTGARYSPDYTYQQLIAAKKVTLHDRMLVRKLVLADGRDTIVAAHGYHQDRPNEVTEYRAGTFVLASGQCWSPHLLLLSANSRFPNGLANRSGTVGRYMNGHKFISAQAVIDEQTFPGQNMSHSLISREYFRCDPGKPFVRHDTRVWESSAGKEPRLRSADGRLQLGDELLNEWRGRALKGSSVRLRAYY
ncbi:MAG TPA: GMC family oxidoreductase N-terminal domain-containing protein, partial [Vicinamibacterales bacterium]|nr:GMC family oxidoreductase N-terminal domain-containing protein [Vicinamibacterales bacterium]